MSWGFPVGRGLALESPANRDAWRWQALGALGMLLAVFGCSVAIDPEEYREVADLRRELAVATRTPMGSGGEGSRCAAAAAREGLLFVPSGGSLTFFADLPRAAALRIERITACGGASGALAVRVTTDRLGHRRTELGPTGGSVAVFLPPAGGPARVDLLAAGPSTSRGGGVLLGGIAMAARVPRAAAKPSSLPVRPSILVFLIDALRRDALGCYGNPRPLSPHLDRFAAQGTLFADAVAQAASTRTAVASLFTGLLPESHGVLVRRDALSEETTTLAELLQGAGYRTLSLLANGNIGRLDGFHQGFEKAWQRLGGPRHRARAMSAEALGWLDATARDPRPFFVYLHVVEPHGPYQPQEPFRSRFARDVSLELGSRRSLRGIEMAPAPPARAVRESLRALYDAEVATADAAFGQLRAGLERRRLWEKTVVVVLADHGEEFFEHGRWEHGSTLHAETLSIPLLIRVPGVGAGRRVRRVAQQVDLLPTLLELAAAPLPPRLDGTSLLGAIAGRAGAVPRPATSFQRFGDLQEVAVTTSTHRLVRSRWDDGSVTVRLYDRRRDPGELYDVHTHMPITTSYLDSVLRWPRRSGPTLARPASRPSREIEEQLRALGYVN